MKKILLPVDFSSHTYLTCEYALSLLQQSGGEIRLFNAYIDQVILADNKFPDAIDMTTKVNEELLKEIIFLAKNNLHNLQHHLEDRISELNIPDISVSRSLAGGTIKDELRTVCHEFQPDAVVMGSRGKGGKLSTWGKVSSYIIEHARIPVLTVPPIDGYLGYRNIMFAADLSEWNAGSLKVLQNFYEEHYTMAPFRHKYSASRHSGRISINEPHRSSGNSHTYKQTSTR
jgi:nucleotide-binding universal stress UspA family protein